MFNCATGVAATLLGEEGRVGARETAREEGAEVGVEGRRPGSGGATSALTGGPTKNPEASKYRIE